MTVRIIVGHVVDKLADLPDESVQCVVTRPPYYGLRDYGIDPQVWGGDPECPHEWAAAPKRRSAGPHGTGVMLDGGRAVVGAQDAAKKAGTGSFCSSCGAWRGALGLDPTYPLYVEHMVEVFRAVRRVLRRDGTLWLNIGDSYATGAGAVDKSPGGGRQGDRWVGVGPGPASGKHQYIGRAIGPTSQPNRQPQPGLKPKDLMGIPWRIAFALQDDGWWLRQDIIWSKPNPMPESIKDRCTKAHEYLFLLSKSERYHYDQAAILEPCSPATHARLSQDVQAQVGSDRAHAGDKTNGRMKAVRCHQKESATSGPANWTDEQRAAAKNRFIARMKTKRVA